jgi:hypothetical protein
VRIVRPIAAEAGYIYGINGIVTVQEMKREYQRNPTEQAQVKLEIKQQTFRRVENQLKKLASSAEAQVNKYDRPAAPVKKPLPYFT